MAFHSKGTVNKLEKQLDESCERLRLTMRGRDAHPDEAGKDSKIERWVNAGDMRIALDNVAAVLKEIRRQLGK